MATAVTVFHPAATRARFAEYVDAFADSARGHAGFLAASASLADFDLAVAVTFTDGESLERWLDSPRHAEVLRRGEALGFWRATTPVVLSDEAPPPRGVAAFRHDVAEGREAEFVSAQRRLGTAVAQAPGYEGTALFPADDAGDWLSVVRFRTDRRLADWLSSVRRTEALPELRSSLADDFSSLAQTTPFGTTVRVDDGRLRMTPNWKSAMMVMLVLYPTVMLLSRFFGPVLDGWGAAPWLALWISQVVSVVLMQWWLMPGATRLFRRWLDPVDGAERATSLRGAAVVVTVYVVTLAIFASITWLQYWDYR
ncbi:antibiotic biosynthesis monooxygenase [Mycolicibacterium baixiangningiae]|uniref:antibiotic biosynthesis monooxygenase n=1 Tax=Mycolicibacterium baixiangningiae TaxID=2761578 RepID=UPI0018692F08|nr:antibiotic biosynthesis monooxygenase [Mycolicibacterium baixiangningiae]